MGLEMELLHFGVTFLPSYTPDLLATSCLRCIDLLLHFWQHYRWKLQTSTFGVEDSGQQKNMTFRARSGYRDVIMSHF